MTKNFSVKFSGASHKVYSYDLYNFPGEWGKVAGVYLVARLDKNNNVVYPIYEVHTAYSGAEALEILRGDRIDILLTDVKMPDMNGVELYRETKKTHPALTNILMTAYAADDIIQQGMAEGIKTVLTKPVDIDLLLSLFSAIEKITGEKS